MSEAPLHCNLQSCRIVLDDKALVTSCSHIFCRQHGQISVKNGKCLACSTAFNNKYDFNMADMQPTDQYKAMIITGLNPEQILDVTSRSISFYTYQLSNECRVKDDLLKQAKAEIEDLKGSYKLEINRLQRIADGFKNELTNKTNELEKCKDQLMQNNRHIKKLQSELCSLKRHLTTVKEQNTPNVQPPSLTRLGLNTGSSRSDPNEEFRFFEDEITDPDEFVSPFDLRQPSQRRYRN